MPIFRKKTKPDANGFYATDIEAIDVVAGSSLSARVGDKKVLLTRAGGSLVAFSAVCPHAAADLSRGRIFSGQIKCPEHGYTFDLRHGRATWPEGEGCHLTRFTAMEGEDGRVCIKLAAPAPGPRG